MWWLFSPAERPSTSQGRLFPRNRRIVMLVIFRDELSWFYTLNSMVPLERILSIRYLLPDSIQDKGSDLPPMFPSLFPRVSPLSLSSCFISWTKEQISIRLGIWSLHLVRGKVDFRFFPAWRSTALLKPHLVMTVPQQLRSEDFTPATVTHLQSCNAV